MPLVAAEGTVWWADPGRDDEARALLDVTEVDAGELDVVAPPLQTDRLRGVLVEPDPAAARRAHGQPARPGPGQGRGRRAGPAAPRRRAAGGGRAGHRPRPGRRTFSWTADLDLADLLRGRADRSVRWSVSVRTVWGDVVEVSPLSVDERILAPGSPASWTSGWR